jgi:hypothetical protein
VAWVGFTSEQLELLELLDYVGNNGWSRNSQTDALMPSLLSKCEAAGLALEQIKVAMESVGYGLSAVHQLDRWESKRTTGRFGR